MLHLLVSLPVGAEVDAADAIGNTCRDRAGGRRSAVREFTRVFLFSLEHGPW